MKLKEAEDKVNTLNSLFSYVERVFYGFLPRVSLKLIVESRIFFEWYPVISFHGQIVPSQIVPIGSQIVPQNFRDCFGGGLSFRNYEN